MCDYSLQNVKSRAVKVGDKLTTRRTWADKETRYLYCKKKDARIVYVQYRGANVTALAGKKR